MEPADSPPEAFEIEDQLQRILTSPRFTNAKNPSAFLEVSVRRALKGKKTTGNIVAKSLFKDKFWHGLSNDVRSTAFNLRKTLTRYYDNEGQNDLVTISFPEAPKDKTIRPAEGEAYTPRFAYNPKHVTYLMTRAAYRLLEKSTFGDYRNALEIFESILSRDPRDIRGLIGFVETLTKIGENGWESAISPTLLDVLCPRSLSWEEFTGERLIVEICTDILFALEDRAKNYWRYWAVRAYYSRVTRNDKQEAYFANAIRLDRRATEGFVPYIEFLIVKKADERQALGLIQRYCTDHAEDSLRTAAAGRLFCLADRPEEGMDLIRSALTLDPGNCGAHQMMAVVWFMRKDRQRVLAHLKALQVLCDEESFERFLAYLEEAETKYQQSGFISGLRKDLLGDSSVAIVKF